jgi:hypothetical protein
MGHIETEENGGLNMSLNTNIVTPNKAELAGILRSVADLVEASSNNTVTVTLNVEFNNDKKGGKIN